MNTQISQKLLQLRNAQEWRTNLSGIASIDCPTQNCLIYAAFLSENQNLFWLDIHPRESNQEYPPSRAAQAKAETTPTEITALINEINKFNSVTTAGVSYQNFSAHYAPLINALNSASLYANDNKYSVLIKETKRALEMFDVTQDVWQMYIESTDVSTWRTTHNVSCEYAKSIRELWNEIVGHEDIGKIKDGVLGCWG